MQINLSNLCLIIYWNRVLVKSDSSISNFQLYLLLSTRLKRYGAVIGMFGFADIFVYPRSVRGLVEKSYYHGVMCFIATIRCWPYGIPLDYFLY